MCDLNNDPRQSSCETISSIKLICCRCVWRISAFSITRESKNLIKSVLPVTSPQSLMSVGTQRVWSSSSFSRGLAAPRRVIRWGDFSSRFVSRSAQAGSGFTSVFISHQANVAPGQRCNKCMFKMRENIIIIRWEGALEQKYTKNWFSSTLRDKWSHGDMLESQSVVVSALCFASFVCVCVCSDGTHTLINHCTITENNLLMFGK